MVSRRKLLGKKQKFKYKLKKERKYHLVLIETYSNGIERYGGDMLSNVPL